MRVLHRYGFKKWITVLPKPVVFITAFSILGIMVLVATRAATPFASLDLGTGSNVTSPATAVSGDSTASGGSYAQFNAAAQVSSDVCTGRTADGGVPADKFPGAACTGWQGTIPNLTNYTGSNVITSPTTIQGKIFSNGLIICSNDVVIKKSKIMGTVKTGYAHTNYACGSSTGFTGILLEDVEIDGGNDASSSAIGDHGYTCYRCYVHNTGLGFNGSNLTVEDSYIHDVYGERDCNKYPTDCISHNSVSNLANGSNMKLIHNNLVAVYSNQTAGGGMSAAITMYTHGDTWGAIDNVVIERNRIEAKNASYCVYAGYSRDKVTGALEWATNVRFVDNYFYLNPETNNCGGGPITGWRRGDGNFWSGNMLLNSAGATTPIAEPASNPY